MTDEKKKNLRSEETGQQVANDTTNTVDGKDIESLVNAHEELKLGGEVAADATNNTEDNRSPRGNETGTGGDSNQSSDGAGAETDDGPLLLKAVVEQDPGDAADGGGEVGDDAGHDGAHVSSKSRTAVEPEPADPEEDGAEDDVGDVVRPVGQARRLGVARPLADHDREGERRRARRDVHGRTSGEVEPAHHERPPVRVPRPVRDRVVHDGRPHEDEDDARQDARAVDGRADRKSWAVARVCALVMTT